MVIRKNSIVSSKNNRLRNMEVIRLQATKDLEIEEEEERKKRKYGQL